MQLFITKHYSLTDNHITIDDARIIHQCYHVLRYKPGQQILLQENDTRYTLSIITISKKEIQTEIQSTTISPNITTVSPYITIVIALPNRRDKAELIVQKCTEIGIDEIIRRTADRSIIRDLPDKKLTRLQTITLEGAEQSYRRSLPTITHLANIRQTDILTTGQIILFHQDGIPYHELTNNNTLTTKNQELRTIIIWPEWWFSPQEMTALQALSNLTLTNLWDTILRMETAAIIWSRLIKNSVIASET